MKSKINKKAMHVIYSNEQHTERSSFMNLRQLRIFQSVCETENITKTAQLLFMTQPAVSHAIRNIEEAVGYQLFDRIGKRIHVNEMGKCFLERVDQVLMSYELLQDAIPQLEYEAELRIGSSITIANDWLPSLIRIYQTQYPQTPLQISVDRAKVVLEKLTAHEIDIAFVEGVITDPAFVKIPVSSYALLFVCANSHPLASKKIIEWSDIPDQQWLLREKGSAVRDTFDSAMHLHQLSIRPLWTSVNSQALLQAVKQNLGITILPEILLEKEMERDKLTVLTLKDTILHNENHILYRKDSFLSKPMQELMKITQRIVADEYGICFC